ncbi:hypothetical protein TWF703_011184 [Orbilia oligospora]|uniref:MsrB domain-containing protein n=2 Tax=Orbilia oligospora TaxID=2813651 RepID=A0A7C8JKU9_ORBOL|nr:hypothetical protein TWF703_011184 [Orbilia oligospora]
MDADSGEASEPAPAPAPAPGPYSHLTMAQYRSLILRQTEHPFSSSLPLLSDDQKSSSYACANCSSPLFLPNTKFASGTGWPAFSSAIPGAIKTKTDWRLKEDGKWVVLGGSLGLKLREEVVCGRCGGHLGHVFRGEKWAKVEEEVEGKGVTRYCVNGCSLVARST